MICFRIQNSSCEKIFDCGKCFTGSPDRDMMLRMRHLILNAEQGRGVPQFRKELMSVDTAVECQFVLIAVSVVVMEMRRHGEGFHFCVSILFENDMPVP